MTRPVRVTISGPDEGREIGPTIDDVLQQLRDFLDVLRSVERAAEPSDTSRLVWRVTDAAMNSPISIELTPTGAGSVEAVAAHVERVERIASDGFRALRRGEPRPPYFRDDAIAKARRMHERVLDGLTATAIVFPPDIQTEAIVIDRPAARDLQRALELEKAAVSSPYAEMGSIEGFVTKPELDGFGRAILRFKGRLSGAEIKAFAGGQAFRQVAALRMSDVWEGVRVRVYGAIHYKTLGHIEHINATGIELLDSESLPGIDDIVDPSFTRGLSTHEFLREQRRDD